MSEQAPKGKSGQVLELAGNILLRNLPMKLFALFLSIVLWVVVVTSTDSLRTRVIYEVPVEISGGTRLDEKGFAVRYEQLSALQVVTVEVQMPQKDLSKANNQTLKASIDLSKITQQGTQVVSITATVPTGGQVIKCIPGEITLDVEPMMTTTVPVERQFTGTLPEDYRIDQIAVSPDRVRISGPASVIEQVASALVAVSLDNITTHINQSLSYTLVDAADQPIASAADDIRLLGDSTVILSARVEPMQVKPIIYDQSIVGVPEDGYRIQSVDIQPSQVQISASREVLDALDAVPLATIDVQGKTEGFTQMVSLNKPREVNWSKVDQVSVTVNIVEETARKTFTDMEVQVINQPTGTDLVYDDSIRVRLEIEAARSVIRDLTRGDVEVFIDLSAVGVGVTNLPIEVRIRDNPAFTVTASPAALEISLKSLSE